MIPELIAKHQILSRRIASLPSELDSWRERAAAGNTLQKNFSQIEALYYFMHTLCRLNEDSFSALDPAGNADVFLSGALDLAANMIKSHTVWDFFRDRLELRFVPQFQRSLLVADLVSHDCYNTIMERAEALRIIPEQGFRGYPLIGLVAGFSPATWARGRRPPALQNHNLPVPVIDLPWDHLVNPWELLTIAHEVGHDIDEDLGKLSRTLQLTLTARMSEVKISAEHCVKWQEWTGEVLADLVGILLAGPAFAKVLAGLLMLPRYYIRHTSSVGKHPPHYLRVLINVALLQRLGMPRSANALEARWKMLYGEPGDEFASYLHDIEPVISIILDTPVAALEDQDGERHSLSELIVFTPDDQASIEEVASQLAIDAPPGRLAVRHLVSASWFAFEQIAATGDVAGLEALAQRTRRGVIDLAPPEQLHASRISRRAQQHLESLAHALLGRPLDNFESHWTTVEGPK
jgi:hypothetical protein